MTASKAIRFLEKLKVPERPRAGQPLRLAPFQRQFIEGALAPGINVGALSIGRGMQKPPCQPALRWAPFWASSTGSRGARSLSARVPATKERFAGTISTDLPGIFPRRSARR